MEIGYLIPILRNRIKNAMYFCIFDNLFNHSMYKDYVKDGFASLYRLAILELCPPSPTSLTIEGLF